MHVGIGEFPPDAPQETLVTGTGFLSSFDPIGLASISDDGRFIAFFSTSSFTPGDTDTASDAYVYDRGRRTLRRMSEGGNGAPPNGASFNPRLSGNGRYVVFNSLASNLVEGDTNGVFDVFRRDLRTGEVLRISVGAAGVQSNGESYGAEISDDGNVVVFLSRASNLVAGDGTSFDDVFVRTVSAETTVRASVAPGGGDPNSSSQSPMISGDGKRVAFTSDASNLVAPDTNLREDVFVHELPGSTTVRISDGFTGMQANDRSSFPSLSYDGRFVSFVSLSTNLVPENLDGTFVRDLVAQTTIHRGSRTFWPRLSDDGRTMGAHTLDEAFLYDRVRGTRTPLVPPDGAHWYWPTPSGNGRYVVVRESGSTAVIVAPISR